MLIRCLLVFAFSCAGVLVPSYSLGQESGKPLALAKPDAAMDKGMEQQLIRLTQEFAAAERRSDTAVLDRLLSDDFTFTHSGGRVDPKTVYLDSLKTGSRRYETFDLENVQVRLYGAAALATGHLHIKVINTGRPPNEFLSQYTFVWVRQQSWRMVALQLTLIPETPAAANPSR